MENIVVPNPFTSIYYRLENIERLLIDLKHDPVKKEQVIENLWFDLNQLRNYHPDKPAAATVYGWVSRNEIPYHKRGKKLSFLKSEIDAWLKTGKQLTKDELTEAADNALLIKQPA